MAERASHASPFPVGGRVVGGLLMEIEERCEGKDMEDATFDGKKVILIFLGYEGARYYLICLMPLFWSTSHCT